MRQHPQKSPYFVDLRVSIIIKSNTSSFTFTVNINVTTSFPLSVYKFEVCATEVWT